MNPFDNGLALNSMEILGVLMAAAAIGLVALTVGMQVVIRRRSQAMNGAEVSGLPGEVGTRVSRSPHALVYFFSPTCGACRAITPRIRELQKTNAEVFAVDVTQDPELARALNVMATPSSVEIADGVIAGYYVGPIPPAVYARFST